MHDPIYECTGPNASEVRKHQLRLFTSQFLAETRKDYSSSEKNVLETIITNVLEEYIPDAMTGFGSYRGYFTFGLEDKLTNKIKTAIQNQISGQISSVHF